MHFEGRTVPDVGEAAEEEEDMLGWVLPRSWEEATGLDVADNLQADEERFLEEERAAAEVAHKVVAAEVVGTEPFVVVVAGQELS